MKNSPASAVVRRMLGESVEDAPPLPVIETTKPVSIHVCPHCKQEIHEKHTYIGEDGVDRHSDCGGKIRFPLTNPANVVAWLRPYVATSYEEREAQAREAFRKQNRG